MQKYNLNYENALRNINLQVNFIKERIKSLPVIIEGVGEFSSDKEEKIIFNPYNNFNFELNSFWIRTFQNRYFKFS